MFANLTATTDTQRLFVCRLFRPRRLQGCCVKLILQVLRFSNFTFSVTIGSRVRLVLELTSKQLNLASNLVRLLISLPVLFHDLTNNEDFKVLSFVGKIIFMNSLLRGIHQVQNCEM